MDDDQKIHHIVNDESQKFQVNQIIDFSHHEMRREIFKLRDQDWIHVHISDQAITIDGRIHSLQTCL